MVWYTASAFRVGMAPPPQPPTMWSPDQVRWPSSTPTYRVLDQAPYLDGSQGHRILVRPFYNLLIGTSVNLNMSWTYRRKCHSIGRSLFLGTVTPVSPSVEPRRAQGPALPNHCPYPLYCGHAPLSWRPALCIVFGCPLALAPGGAWSPVWSHPEPWSQFGQIDWPEEL